VGSFSGNDSPKQQSQSNKYKNENGQNNHNNNNCIENIPHQSINHINPNQVLTKANFNKTNLINKLTKNYEDNEDTATISSSCTKKIVVTLNDEFVELQILLPDNSIVTLNNIKQNASADDVYKNLIDHLKIDSHLSVYFYLFEIIDQSFERKLRPHEQPNLINIQNYSNKCSTCICLRKWYFNLKVESLLAKNQTTLKYLFHQVRLKKVENFFDWKTFVK
jgi:hypothetical protein